MVALAFDNRNTKLRLSIPPPLVGQTFTIVYFLTQRLRAIGKFMASIISLKKFSGCTGGSKRGDGIVWYSYEYMCRIQCRMTYL